MEYQRSARRGSGVKKREQDVELLRLLCSLLLFLGVFLGKQIYPETMLRIGTQVRQVIASTVDLEESFAALGRAVELHGVELKDLGTFCVEVFGPQPVEEKEEPGEGSVFVPEKIERAGSAMASIRSRMPALLPEERPSVEEREEVMTQPEPAVPAVGTVVVEGERGSKDPPPGYTVDHLSFGALETVTPVLGHLNSGFGYRDHPVNGKYLFHGGVDISGNTGDPIRAFGDGRVEYIGKNDSYGLYLQLDHGSGIKSFYAHCQELRVKKGQQVTAGETVALIGSTGTSTGPHLHLELKCGTLRVDPAWYVDFLQKG